MDIEIHSPFLFGLLTMYHFVTIKKDPHHEDEGLIR